MELLIFIKPELLAFLVLSSFTYNVKISANYLVPLEMADGRLLDERLGNPTY